MAKKCHPVYKPSYGKIGHFRDFIKSAVANSELGVVITWIISIVKKIFIATATCLEGVDLFNQ